jgi:site-specific DNA-adenine methylase
MSSLWRGFVMLLKKRHNAKYGLPYMGSKSKIIENIARYFPNADNFYDLFGGGFSVSHYMAVHRNKSYKNFYYNELRSGLCQLIQDSISGKYNYDVFKPDWISKERFFAEKESNAYIKYIWSFGNNGRDYLFGKDIYGYKKSMHQAVVFDEFDDFMKNILKISKWPNKLNIVGKRLLLIKIISGKYKPELQQLQQLLQLERLQQLEAIKNKIEFTNLSYEKVIIKPNSVIYCDIPYKGTADYKNEFSHKYFFDWANNQENPVFISEYNIDDDRFFLLKEINHRSTLSSSANNHVVERIYGNRAANLILNQFKNGV